MYEYSLADVVGKPPLGMKTIMSTCMFCLANGISVEDRDLPNGSHSPLKRARREE